MSINWQEAKRAAEQGVAAEAAKQASHRTCNAARGPAEPAVRPATHLRGLCATITQPNQISKRGEAMAKRLKDIKEIRIERPLRAKLSAAESLKRTQEFDKRREKFIASIRKSKG